MFTAGPTWITEWQYDAVRPLVRERADLMVFLLYSRSLVMRRVAHRTLSRRVRRTQLWNGNREAPLRTFLTDPEHVVRWAWRVHPQTLQRFEEVRERGDVVVVALRTPRELEAWLAGPLAAALGQ